MTEDIRVAVLGASGRMGSTVVSAVGDAPGMRVVAAIDAGDDFAEAVTADVAVDFTVPTETEANVLAMIKHGVHTVVGTTGWTQESIDRVSVAAEQRPDVGVLIAPNFALGAVLTMVFAERAAAFFESVEVIELHHPNKVDAPSGTAQSTAARIAAARASAGLSAQPDATEHEVPGARGARIDGIPVHSVRLRGLTAHEEVLFGGPGEQLTIRHDSFDRWSFMPGVIFAIREIARRPGVTMGLEHYLDLS